MTRLSYSFAGLAAAMLGLWILVPKLQSDGVGLDMTTTASIATAGQQFRLASAESSTACTVTKGKRVSFGVYQVSAGPACQALMPGMARVRFWRQKSDGVVEFKGEGGETLAAFAESGGQVYESFRPRAPFMTLTRQKR